MGAPIDDLPVQDSNVLRVRSPQWCPTCPFGSPGPSASVFKGSPAHVSSLSGPATAGRYPAGYATSDRRRADPSAAGFPSPFGHRHPLLGHPVPPRDSAPLTIGLPGQTARTPTGFPRSTHTRHDRIGCPLYPETSGVHPTGRARLTVAACRPLPAARSYHPGHSSRLPGAENDEASSRVHSRSPVRSSPRPVAPPDGTGAPWAPSSSFAPHRPGAGDARRGRRRTVEHKPVATRPTLSTSYPCSSIDMCDLASHGPLSHAHTRGRRGHPRPARTRVVDLGDRVDRGE